MYVCLCYSVTDGDVRSLLDDGVSSAGEIMDLSGAGSGCGGCQGILFELLTTSGIRVDDRPWGGDQPGCSAAPGSCPIARAGLGSAGCASRTPSQN